MKNTTLLRNTSAAAFMAAILALPSSLHATTYTWDGGGTGGGWVGASGTANWNPDATITSGSQTDLVFDSTTHMLAGSGSGSYIGNSITVRSLRYTSNINANVATSFNFFNAFGANLTMQADVGNASITVDAGETGSIQLGAASGVGSAYGNLILASNLDVINNGGQLQFNRIVSGTCGINKTGSGELALTGGTFANTYSGLTTVSAGNLTLFKNAGVDSISIGGLLVNGGTVNLSNASNQINDAANVEITSGTFSMTTFSDTVNNVKLTGGSITSTSGTLTSTTAFDLQSGTSSARLVSTAGATKSTSGTVVLSAANTISGLITVNAGTLNFSASGNTLSGGATVNSGTLQLGGFNTLTGSTLTVNSGGTLLASTSGATGQDMDSASSLILNGGTLRINPSFVASSKSYNTVPVTVSSASTLSYENGAGYSITLGFGGTNAFALNADLTVQNNSTTTTVTNPLNISRAITGAGAMIVETYNNISSSADNYGLGRVLLSGSNSGWSGNLEVSKGTVSLSGSSVPSAGTGTIILGTTSGSSGAGLTFFATSAAGTTATHTNDIIVRSGGFRSIKGGGDDHSIVLSGDILLEGNLNVDHTLSGSTTRAITLSGNISGVGGIDITRAGGSSDSYVVMSGSNSFTGTVNIYNQATLVANSASSAGNDLNAASAINLQGGTLDVHVGSGVNKTYATVPVNVNSASTLQYTNTNFGANYTAQFTGTSAFALNADLALKNTSWDTTQVNAFNIGRNMTGIGNMTVETYNNIASSSDSYGLGRVLLSGSNSGWSGNLVVSKGTVSLSGSAVPSAGTGTIILGTTSGTSGAGMTFFPTSANGSTATFANNIIVRSGGFRSIKGSNTDNSILLSGSVTLEGDLNLDSTFSSASNRFLMLSGIISGTSGLNITRAGGSTNTSVRLTGSNTYTGATTIVAGASLTIGSNTDAGSIESSSSIINNGSLIYFVGSGSRTYSNVISGTGTLTQNSPGGSLTLAGTNTYTGLTSVSNGTLNFDVSETLTGGLNIATSGTAVLKAHTGGPGNVKVLDISSLTISGTTPFVGGGKDISLADGGLGASAAPVPEPATWAMLLSGLGLLGALRRASRRKD